jgi:phage tail tube protein FII
VRYAMFELCTELRKTLEKDSSGDSYPNYQTAFLHAASILYMKQEMDEAKYNAVEEILNCVNKKYGADDYKSWIGQSFIYIKLWESTSPNVFIPENNLQNYFTEEQLKLRSKYYKESSKLTKAAFEKIDELREALSDQSKDFERNKRYYYAINNYIYIETTNRPLEDFPGDLTDLVKKLEGIAKPDLQHERYYDTLARFDLRMAVKIARTEKKQKEKYSQYLESSLKYIKKAIDRAKNKKNEGDLALFDALESELQRIKIHGLEYYSNKNS